MLKKVIKFGFILTAKISSITSALYWLAHPGLVPLLVHPFVPECHKSLNLANKMPMTNVTGCVHFDVQVIGHRGL